MSASRRAVTRVVAAFLLAAAPAARAAWHATDLPYRTYLNRPVTGLAPAGAAALWAVSAYPYGDPERDHVRWNSLAWHTANDGLLWDLPWDAPGDAPTPNARVFQDVQLYAASFADERHGWLFGRRRPTFGVNDPPGDFTFYRTTDGGWTWSESTLPNTTPGADSDAGFSLDAVDATHAIAVHGRHVFETEDGVTWTERPGRWPRMNAVQARGLPAPRVAGEEDGRAISGILTPNGFTADASAAGTFHAVHFRDAAHGWLAGGDGTAGCVLRTDDGGKTWETALTVPDSVFHGIAAPDADHVWAAGGGVEANGVVYASDDGGATWSLRLATPGRLFPVVFRDARRGFAAGDGGVFRFVPGASAPGDLDASGHVDLLDAAAVLRMAAGLRAASAQDVETIPAPEPVTLASAVAALRRAHHVEASPEHPAARALVVYNTLAADGNGDGMGDSEEVARYYAMRRGIPPDRLVAIAWPDTESFSAHGLIPSSPRANWTDAFHAIVEPLRARLDTLGRGSVDTIVFTYGVPYRLTVGTMGGWFETLTVDQSVNDPYAADAGNWSSFSPYAAMFSSLAERYGRPRFGAGGRPMGQPFVDASGAVRRGPFYLTGRLDGPSVAACKAMVDNALFAEAYYGPGGYEGIAYIDTRATGYNAPTLLPYDLDRLRRLLPAYDSYSGYDAGIARAIVSFAGREHPWRDEITPASIGEPNSDPRWRDGDPATAAPRAMFYAGWYNYGRYFDVWDWLPGSVGIDFDSASASGFRDGRFFAGGALGAGLSALVGVIDEPFNGHPKPDALMEYLARGFSLGEAAMLASDTPRTARALAIGDPLYRPFAPRPSRPVPAPALSLTETAGEDGRAVTVESDIPVRAALHYTTDASPPDLGSPAIEGTPPFFARRHTFPLPPVPDLRYVVRATDPKGRVTEIAGAASVRGAGDR